MNIQWFKPSNTKIIIDSEDVHIDSDTQLYEYIMSGQAQERFLELNPEEIIQVGFFDGVIRENNNLSATLATNILILFSNQTEKWFHAKVTLGYQGSRINSQLEFEVLEFNKV
jgi:hypothetical protein